MAEKGKTPELIDLLLSLSLSLRFCHTVTKCLHCCIFLHDLSLTSVDLELMTEIPEQGRLVLLQLINLSGGGGGDRREGMRLVGIVEGLRKWKLATAISQAVVITYQCRLARSQRDLAFAFSGFFDQPLQGAVCEIELDNLLWEEFNAIVKLGSLSELHAFAWDYESLHLCLQSSSWRVGWE